MKLVKEKKGEIRGNKFKTKRIIIKEVIININNNYPALERKGKSFSIFGGSELLS